MTQRRIHSTTASLLLILSCGLWPAPGRAGDTGRPAVDRLEDLTDRLWWQPRAPLHDPLPGTTGSSAAACGQCHAEIYAEWQASTHAHAWTDRQFQQEMAKDPEVAWICQNCHIPAAGQQAERIRFDPERGVRDVERSENERFDAAWQDEGISCMTCHWRPEGIAAPHADAKAPHPTVYAPELSEPALCTSCHQADVRLEDALVCHFTTGEEYEAGGRPETCQGCHMPVVERAVAPGAPVRQTRRHFWPGSRIPKAPWTPEQAALQATWEPGVEARIDLPAPVAPGERAAVEVVLDNVRAGHRVPTGDPERYLLLQVRILAADGRAIAGLDERIGQRWIWWPVALKLDDNRIPAGEDRAWSLPFVMPPDAVSVELSLEHYRISPENAAYHGLSDMPNHRTVQTLSLDLGPAVAGGGQPR